MKLIKDIGFSILYFIIAMSVFHGIGYFLFGFEDCDLYWFLVGGLSWFVWIIILRKIDLQRKKNDAADEHEEGGIG